MFVDESPKQKKSSSAKQHSMQSNASMMALVIVLALTAIGSFTAGYMTGRPNTSNSNRYDVLDEAWSIVDREFYPAMPSDEERIYGAIDGMLQSLKDPHTILLRPSIAARDERRMSGASGGIGAMMAIVDDLPTITSVERGWPAQRSGLRAGDQIIAVNGKSVKGQILDEVISQIRGDIGTEVSLTVQRKGEDSPLDFTIVRDQINVFGTMIDDVAYISFALFNQTAAQDVEKQLNLLLKENPRALILDLRGNTGGLLTSSVDISDLFLPEGLILIEKTNAGTTEEFKAKTGQRGETIPMVVLIDGMSASASEIVAGAMQDRGRAVLIGTNSFGKGSVQAVNTLSDGSQLRVTTGAWYTPNQTAIERNAEGIGGLKPDVFVAIPDPADPERDYILEQALDYIYLHFGTF
jgi:carboxyl-terminal processing protease